MAVPTGTASLLDIQNEFGGSNPISLSEYRGVGPGPTSGEISINTFRGASNSFTLTISSNTANLNVSSAATAAGWNGSAALVVVINAGVYCYATTTSNRGMTLNVANATVKNYGNIIGKGGWGGIVTRQGEGGGGYAGGAALNVTASGTTIINYSGAFIAGGGGGGGGRNNTSSSGGGSGAGSGTTAGRAGGGGGGYFGGNPYPGHAGGWGLPGVGSLVGSGGARGGSGGGVGANASATNYSAGGGGWGARGGSSFGSGGAGGAAITGTSRTLTNNGTVYGGT